MKFLDLSSIRFKKIIDNFNLFLDEKYINLVPEYIVRLKYDLINWINFLKEEIPELKGYEINKNKEVFDFKFNQERIDYVRGWFLQDINNKNEIFINLITFHDILGSDKTKLIYKNIQQYSSKFKIGTSLDKMSVANAYESFDSQLKIITLQLVNSEISPTEFEKKQQELINNREKSIKLKEKS